MVQQPNPVLLYHPDGYRVARQDLKGRHSAGESFLTAYLAQAAGPEVYALCDGKEGADDFAQSVKESGRPLTARAITRGDADTLRRQGLLNLPFPGIAEEARLRSFLGDDAYALCGVTHTISSRGVLDGIADMAVAPVQPWDAVICTSRAVQGALSGVLDRTEESLRARLSAGTFTRPMMPVIPLGVHSHRFTRSEADRTRWRKSLGIADDAVAVLFFGRLSVHAKASPFQLAQAVELAAQRTKKPFVLLWCGRFYDDFQRRVFMNTAKTMAPSVPFHHIDGHDDAACAAIWSAADIFCSLSDNVQESFGLTVIEAMAAGLPVVVSNWNGYREAVEDGVNGFLVDSYMATDGLNAAAYRYVSGVDTYDLHIGALSQICFVDLAQTTAALTRLAQDEGLRLKLANAAKKTIAERFDWKAVMPRYVELWREQIECLNKARAQGGPRSTIWQTLDPSLTFADFASRRLAGDSLLMRGDHFSRWNDLIRQPGIVVNPGVLTGRKQLQALHELFSGEPITVDGATERFGAEEAGTIRRTLHWLIKVGLLKLAPEARNLVNGGRGVG